MQQLVTVTHVDSRVAVAEMHITFGRVKSLEDVQVGDKLLAVLAGDRWELRKLTDAQEARLIGEAWHAAGEDEERP